MSGPLVPLPAESEQVVVLSEQHSAPTREIERIAGHLIAEVVDVEHKLFRQVACIAEDKPAKARIHQPVFMSGHVDGFYLLQPEIPLKLRLAKGQDEPADGGIDVNGISHPSERFTSTSRSLMSSIGSISPVNVVPKTTPTQIVFSSMSSATASFVIVKRSCSSGITRGSTSKYLANLYQQICASAPKMMFGLSKGLPSA